MSEHEKHCVNRCPVCGASQENGYADLDFCGNEREGMWALVRFHCRECGTEYVEQYAYSSTWYEG